MKAAHLQASVWLGLAAMTAAMLPGSARAVEDETDNMGRYAFRREVQTAGSEGLYRLSLPLAVYRGTAHADLRDLRVFNAAGERVPFAFASAPPREADAPSISTLPFFPMRDGPQSSGERGIDLQIRQRPDGTLVTLKSGGKPENASAITAYLIDASKQTAPIRALRFEWHAMPATQSGRVVIDASDDLKSWRNLVNGAPLIDLEFGGQRLAQRRVELPASSTSSAMPKYFRISWTGASFDLTKIEAESVGASRERVLQTLVVAGRANGNPNEFMFDLAAKLPVSRVRLNLPEANTLAPTQLLARADGRANWRAVTGATFYRLMRDGAELVSPPVPAFSDGERYWLARIDPRSGGIGAEAPSLEVAWEPRDIVFVARGTPPFMLAYGNPDARNASFAVSALMPGYRQDAEFNLPSAVLKPVDAKSEAVATSVASVEHAILPIAPEDRKRIVLWAVLVGGVALLAWMAIRLSRDMRRDQSDKSEK